jgi:hypothetical protein
MPIPPSPTRWACLLAAGLLCLAGCDRDEVHSYTVPRPAPESYEAKVRLLAAVFEDGRDQWFFKLVGPTAEVEKHAKDFASFVESVRFTGKADPLVEWKVPAGWEKQAARQLRYATFTLGPGGKPPEVTVFHFDQISPLLNNVNRWCKLDLGRKPLRADEVEKLQKPVRAGANQGVLIDLTGPGPQPGARPMGGPMMAGGGPRRPGKLPLTYTVPAGWEDTGARSSFGITVAASFAIRDGDQKAQVQVTPLGHVGGLLANVNRWREQVGLPSISQAQLDQNPPKKVKMAGADAPYYDFTGPARRMLLVTAENGQRTWYFKMIGSAELVGKNKSKFESFLQSVKFTGVADE